MLDGDEIAQQDANQPESSAPEASSPETGNQEPAQTAETQPKQEQRPFHEDPRVQEYLERQIRKSTETYESRMQEMQRNFEGRLQALQPKAEKQPHDFVQNLKNIKPEWAQYFDQLEAKASKVDELMERVQSFERNNIQSQYERALEQQHSLHKTPDDLKDRIRREVEFEAMRNPKLGLQDLPAVYKQKLDDYTKWVDSIKRSTTASYVQDKSKDVKVPPSQPKGKAPSRSDKGQFTFKNEEDFKASVVASALKRSRAGSDI